MDNVSLLRNTLKPYLKWHGARLSFLALFLIALFRVKTVNLVDLSIGFKSKAKKGSSAGLSPLTVAKQRHWTHYRSEASQSGEARRWRNSAVPLRYGFDHLRSIFLNLDESQADFLQSLKFLSCT